MKWLQRVINWGFYPMCRDMLKGFMTCECEFNSVVCIVDSRNVKAFGRMITKPTGFDVVICKCKWVDSTGFDPGS